jgi:hypothetical protein
MTVTGCGVWVTHAHATGTAPHVHGWGLAPAGCPVCRDHRPDGPSTTHRHLLVFGVECPNEECPANSPPPGGQAVVGLLDPGEASTPADPSPVPSSQAGVVTVIPLPDSQPAGTSPAPALPVLLPPFTLRHVSGVRRA